MLINYHDESFSKDKSVADDAVDKASKTSHEINGIEVLDMTASVVSNSGKITNYRTRIKISLAVD
jgi:flavin-binding protein dodecin